MPEGQGPIVIPCYLVDGTPYVLEVDANGYLQVSVEAAAGVGKTFTPYNIPLAFANTEYSQALPANCKRFEFQCRTSYDVRWAMVTGKVAGSAPPYFTLKSGQAFDSGALSLAAGTLYFASSTAGVVVELWVWT